MLEATTHLQLILGPDKRNPSFCLYTDAQEKELHVYYGLELLEVLPNDRDRPAYRLLAARLANANVRLATLEAVFGLDRKTMRTWGRALRSGRPPTLCTGNRSEERQQQQWGNDWTHQALVMRVLEQAGKSGEGASPKIAPRIATGIHCAPNDFPQNLTIVPREASFGQLVLRSLQPWS